MDARTTLTLRCTACGALAEATCKCGVGYAYISPGELAAKAVKANPGMSDRAIADEIGIGLGTVQRARKSTDPNESVEKRTGKDCKTRRMPRRKNEQPKPEKARVGRRGQSMPQLERAREIVRPLMDAGKPFQCHDLEREHGISHYTFDSAICAEKARIEAFDEVGALADFSKMTAKQKLDAAIRAQKKQQERDHRIDFMNAIDAQIKKITPDLQEKENKAFEAEQLYRKFLDQQKKIFTAEQFKSIIRCLHPDSRNAISDAILAEAFRLFNAKKFALTGEK